MKVREAALRAIERVEAGGAYTDLVLSSLLPRTGLDTRDRALVSELVRGVIRWKKRLDWIVGRAVRSRRLPGPVRWTLWLGLYQLQFTRIPAHAAVSESVNLIRDRGWHKWSGLVNAVLRAAARNEIELRFPDIRSDPVLALAVRHSYPEWLVARWIGRHGEEFTSRLCAAGNRRPPLSVRPNLNRLSCDEFEQMLNDRQIVFEKSVLPPYYRVRRMPPGPWLERGLISIQDESAGAPVRLADAERAGILFDLCAAPGGKAFHLAEEGASRAVILAGDLNPRRARLVKKGAQRLGMDNLFVVAADGRHFPGREADVVIVDAPCSGLGVLRRKPDLRWRRQPEQITELSRLQRSLLERAALRVRAGGTLIYATCTTEPEENEEVVSHFLTSHPDFERKPARGLPEDWITGEGEVRTWPHIQDTDGSYCVKLSRVVRKS